MLIEKQLLTPAELAAYLKMNVGSLYHWTSARRIPFIKIGKLIRFDRKAIDAWLEQSSVEEKKPDEW